MYRFYNINPEGKRVGDCVIRAISIVTDKDWIETYIGLALQGFIMADMPSSNEVWGAYLKGKGFERRIIPNTCPDCYTVKDFCADYPQGVYLLALPSHVVAVVDGDYLDIWDSGDEVPMYYWTKGE